MTSTSVLDALRERAREAAGRAHAPYSRRPAGAAVLLTDGSWIAGARVENASFPLTIPAATAAMCAARVAGVAAEVRAIASSIPFEAGEAEALAAILADAVPGGLSSAAADALAAGADLPEPAGERSLALGQTGPIEDTAGIVLAGHMAERAHVPVSRFPVGCVVLTSDGRLFGGANVEGPDWTRGLCAERVALATMVSSGARSVQRVWLACTHAPGCTPCGACRQVLSELAPSAVVVMAREDGHEVTNPSALLPGAFDATQLS